jgi:hypothetical protein
MHIDGPMLQGLQGSWVLRVGVGKGRTKATRMGWLWRAEGLRHSHSRLPAHAPTHQHVPKGHHHANVKGPWFKVGAPRL